MRALLCLLVLATIVPALLAATTFSEIDIFTPVDGEGVVGSGVSLDSEAGWAIVGDQQWEDSSPANTGRIIFHRRNETTGLWSEFQTVSSPAPVEDGQFGVSTAIQFPLAIIGEYRGGTDDEGVVYAYTYSTTTSQWELTFTFPTAGSLTSICGRSVDLFDDIAALGCSKHGTQSGPYIEVYRRDSGANTWTQLQVLSDAGTTQLGEALLFSKGGECLIAGVRATNNYEGGAVVFEWNGSQYAETARFSPPQSGSGQHFRAVSITDDCKTAVMGGYGAEQAVIFRKDGAGDWVLTADQILDYSATAPGSGFGSNVRFGRPGERSVLIVAADDANDIYVFDEVGGEFVQVDVINGGSTTQAGDRFPGFDPSATLNGPYLLAGSADTSSSGRAFLFELAASSYPANPLRCGSYDSSNTRYFYHDETPCETTPTTADACYYTASDLGTTLPATLRVDGQASAPVSRLQASGQTDYIYVAFDLPDKYYNHELVFADAAAAACLDINWELMGAARDVTDRAACYTTYEYRMPWANAYSSSGDKCGWVRDSSGANVKLTLDFAVRATEDLSTNRAGDTLTRTVDFSMPVQVEFPTQVVADTENIQVFGEVRALAIVTEQSVTIDEPTEVATMKIRLFTEVQAPFELHTISETSNTLTTGTDGQDGLPTGITVATTFTDVNVLKTTACSNPAAICAATWEFEYETPSVAGGSNPCEFDGLYEVSFVVGCSDENANGDCPIDSSTDSVSIQFTVNTNNHCPSVIDSVDLSASLEVYDTQARTGGEQDDFVGDGTTDNGQTPSPDDWQVAYFAAPTKSDQVAIDETELNQVWIIRGDTSKVVLLDADNVHNDAPYNSVGAITCTPVQQPGDGNDADKATVTLQTGCDPTNPAGGTYNFDFKHGEGGNAAATAFSTPIFQFDVRTDSEGFDMADDAIETMTVHAVIDVRYANAAKRSAGVVQNEPRTDFTSVERTFQTNGQAASASSSSSSLFGMSSMMVYAAAATLAVVVVGVLVVVLKKPSQPAMEKVESSTELASTAV